jgi:hypothetical protein
MIKLVSTLLTILLLTEFSLRIIQPESLQFYWIQKQYHSFSDDYLVDLEPNTNVRLRHFQNIFDIKFSTNERGFRGTGPINNSLPQIACIGDSVTMGFGVSDEDTFCSKLNNFKDSNGTIYQSVNLGVDAYGPSAISRKLSKKIDELNIKILLYFPSNGDDIDEFLFWNKMNNHIKFLLFKFQFLAAKNSYLFLSLKIAQEQLTFRFFETFVYPFINLNIHYDCLLKRKPSDECKYHSIKDILLDFLADFRKRPVVEKNAPPIFPEKECISADPIHPIPEIVYKSTNEILEIAKQRNIKIIFFLSPIDIETAYCSQMDKNHNFYNYSRTLKTFLIKNNIDFVDLNEFTKEMIDSKERLNPRPYYIIGDGHYTEKGNEWVYRNILKKLGELH